MLFYFGAFLTSRRRTTVPFFLLALGYSSRCVAVEYGNFGLEKVILVAR